MVNNLKGILPTATKEIPKAVKLVPTRTITLQGVNQAEVQKEGMFKRYLTLDSKRKERKDYVSAVMNDTP